MEWYLHLGPISDIVTTVKNVDTYLRGIVGGATWLAGKVGDLSDATDDEPDMVLVDDAYVAKANRIHNLLQQAMTQPMTGDNPMLNYVQKNITSKGDLTWVVNDDGSVTYGDVTSTDNIDLNAASLDDLAGIDGLPEAEFPLPGPISDSTVQPPEGYIETTQYWSTAELMTFQLELALKARWSAIGNKMLMDGLGMATGFAQGIGGLLDFAGGVFNPLAWGTEVGPSGAYDIYAAQVINGWCFPVPKSNADIRTYPKDPGGYLAPREYRNGIHMGVDIRGDTGDPILALFSGTVYRISRTDTGNAGLCVGITSVDGRFKTFGCHFSSVIPGLKVGSTVQAGQVIAYMGSTGSSSAPHLHIEIKAPVNGVTKYVNPKIYLQPLLEATRAKSSSVVLPGVNTGSSRNNTPD